MLIVLDPGNGQMCNQILMQMNVLASAYEHGYQVIYYNHKRYDGPQYQEDSLNGIIVEKDESARIRTVIAKVAYKCCQFFGIKNSHIVMAGDEECVRRAAASQMIKKRKLWCFGWPYYDLNALRANADLIRKYFSPNPEIKAYVDGQRAKISDSEIVVGVHMRRGDYRTWRNGAFFFEDAVYKKYMDTLSGQLPDKKLTFILFSNEPVELSHFQSNDYQTITSNGTAMQDFYLMASCDYLIGPPSSFNGLASFLGNVPRYIVMNDNDELKLDNMYVWLQQTDGWVNPI